MKNFLMGVGLFFLCFGCKPVDTDSNLREKSSSDSGMDSKASQFLTKHRNSLLNWSNENLVTDEQVKEVKADFIRLSGLNLSEDVIKLHTSDRRERFREAGSAIGQYEFLKDVLYVRLVVAEKKYVDGLYSLRPGKVGFIPGNQRMVPEFTPSKSPQKDVVDVINALKEVDKVNPQAGYIWFGRIGNEVYVPTTTYREFRDGRQNDSGQWTMFVLNEKGLKGKFEMSGEERNTTYWSFKWKENGKTRILQALEIFYQGNDVSMVDGQRVDFQLSGIMH